MSKIAIDTYRSPDQFQGWFAPAFMVEMFENKELSAVDIVMLCAIDSFMHPKNNCRESNQELADYVGLGSPQQASQKLHKFARMGLITITHLPGNVRELSTTWYPKIVLPQSKR